MPKKSLDPQIEIARLARDAQITGELVSLLRQPLMQSIAALVLLEALQRYQLIGQNVSTALEVAIASKEAIAALAPAVGTIQGFIPGLKGG